MNIQRFEFAAIDDFGNELGACERLEVDGDYVRYADHVASHAFDEARETELCRADWLNDWSEDRPVYADHLKGWLACAKSRAEKP